MEEAQTSGCLLLPLNLRPEIHQAGMGEHGARREESFFRPSLWALHLYFWRGHLSFGGKRYPIQPHSIGLTPPNTTLTWHFPSRTCRHLFVHFSFSKRSKEQNALPIMCALGNRFTQVNQQFEGIAKLVAKNRDRAEVMLWDLLWGLTDLIQTENPVLTARPGPVETALGLIENELDRGLNAKSLAERVAVSYSQLNRLFKGQFGTTLSNYIAQERFKRADHLLRDTNFSIKAIAEHAGMPDLQHFNKFIRLHTGMAPRVYREANAAVAPRRRR